MRPLTDKQKRIVTALMVALVAILFGLLLFYVHEVRHRDDASADVSPVLLQDILDAEVGDIVSTKSEGYASGIDRYWDELDDNEFFDNGEVAEDPLQEVTPDRPARPGSGGLRVSPISESSYNYDFRDFMMPEEPQPQERPRVASPRERAASTSYDGVSDLEMQALEMMMRAMNGEKPAEEPAVETEEEPERIVVGRASVRRSGAVSSLDDGGGISSLDDSDAYVSEDDERPYRCMFTKTEKVANGQRISLRLLEDLLVDGVLVPRNTHLTATVTFGGSRLSVRTSSLEIGGRILDFVFDAYDSDGTKGIYCATSVNAQEKRRRDVQRGSQIASPLARASMVGTAARVADVAVQVFQGSGGEKTVELPAGYEFYIVKSKKY